MTKMKKMLAIGATVLMIVATSVTALAATNGKSPAEILAGLTGKSVESVVADKTASDKTYGTLASEAGKLTEFKAQMLENRKAVLAEKVAAGTMTQERANQMITTMEQNQANCDGSGAARMGQKKGAGFGNRNGNGEGCGQGNCQGTGNGAGQGAGFAGRSQGRGAGTCQAQ